MTKPKLVAAIAFAAMLALALAAAGAARAVPAFTLIDSLAINDLSDDATVACGNSVDGLYEPCRWTASDGFRRLGRSSVAANGHGGGVPGLSADGNRVASTIAATDLNSTPGLWIKGSGWVETMPPLLPDGGEIDQSYGSAWDLSRDGTTVVGLYWRPGASDGSAHAFKWTAAGGLVGLGGQGHDSRANGVSADGSVVAGWSSQPALGNVWQPTVWDADGLTVLAATDMWCEAKAVNDAGTIVVGDSADHVNYPLPMITATMWKRTAAGWDQFQLGVLPGTFGNAVGHATALAVNDDGTVVAGVNAYDHYNTTGFIWTEEEGLMKASEYFAARGVTLPPTFAIASVTAIANDGRAFAGYGTNPLDWRAPPRSFVVSFGSASGVPGPAAPAAAPAAALVSARPNPFSPATTLGLVVSRAGPVRVRILDARGACVRTLHDGELADGAHALAWDGRDDRGRAVASGLYRAVCTDGEGGRSARTLTLVR